MLLTQRAEQLYIWQLLMVIKEFSKRWSKIMLLSAYMTVLKVNKQLYMLQLPMAMNCVYVFSWKTQR